VPRAPAAVISEFQHSRVLAAALEEASACGYEQTSVTAIVARAGVSRKTFYELYESREGCFRAVFEEAVAQIAEVLEPLYADGAKKWSERVRAALAALLAFVESNREAGAFVLEYVVEGANKDSESRKWLLEHLRRVVEDGSEQAKAGHESSPLTAEVVVGGVLAVLHARLQARSRDLMSLLNPLMWMIVLPYLGPAAAAKEMRRALPDPALKRTKSRRGPLEGLGMRVTYRTARVLAAIEQDAGRSNVEIGDEVEVGDAGQISKLLARLEGYGLIENTGAGHANGAPNAWHLTRKGEEVDAAIRHQFAAGGPPRKPR
jgi:AcrR family transcriptional regulator/DNA-binding MarR family transcriptional regulator